MGNFTSKQWSSMLQLKEEEKDSMCTPAKSKVSPLMLDPRSPNKEISRTPIWVENEKFGFTPKKMLECTPLKHKKVSHERIPYADDEEEMEFVLEEIDESALKSPNKVNMNIDTFADE